MLNKRVHVLFDKDLWNKLKKLSKVQNISAGEFVREAVSEQIERKKELLAEQKQRMPFKGFFKPRG